MRKQYLKTSVLDHERNLKEKKERNAFEKLFENRKNIEVRIAKEYEQRMHNQMEIEDLEQREIEMIMKLQHTQRMQQTEVDLLEKVL